MQPANITTTLIRETLDRLNRSTGGQLQARIGMPEDPGWVRGTNVLTQPEQYVPAWLDAMQASLGARGRKVVASFFLKGWLRQVVLASTGCYLLQQRVPDVGIDNLAFHIGDDGRVDEIAFLGGRILALDDDPAAGSPEVNAFPTIDDLRAGLRDTIARDHVAPLIEALRPLVPVGDRFMWATTADTVVGFILLLGNRLQIPVDPEHEAQCLAGMEPLKGKTGAMRVEHDGRTTLALSRGCCCFAYHLDQYDKCKTCPLQSREAQIANIQEQMAAGKA